MMASEQKVIMVSGVGVILFGSIKCMDRVEEFCLMIIKSEVIFLADIYQLVKCWIVL